VFYTGLFIMLLRHYVFLNVFFGLSFDVFFNVLRLVFFNVLLGFVLLNVFFRLVLYMLFNVFLGLVFIDVFFNVFLRFVFNVFLNVFFGLVLHVFSDVFLRFSFNDRLSFNSDSIMLGLQSSDSDLNGNRSDDLLRLFDGLDVCGICFDFLGVIDSFFNWFDVRFRFGFRDVGIDVGLLCFSRCCWL
jgi:hypothetical protein